MAAPTAASNYVDHVPAHRFYGREQGLELRAIVVPEAEQTWGIYNRAAEFDEAGRHYAVGIRQELPGDSLFLPDTKRISWYRRDGDDLLGLASWTLEMALMSRMDSLAPGSASNEPVRIGPQLTPLGLERSGLGRSKLSPYGLRPAGREPSELQPSRLTP
jgi:hypothetical protein